MAFWAAGLAGIAKAAQSRGRNVVGWILLTAVASGLGGWLGISLLRGMIDAEASLGVVGSSLSIPVLGLALPLVAALVALRYGSVKTRSNASWPVHFVDRGPGRILIDRFGTQFVWSDTAIAVRVQRVAADGECVRIGCVRDGEPLEVVAIPLGTPATPTGRRSQSVVLARQLRPVPAPTPILDRFARVDVVPIGRPTTVRIAERDRPARGVIVDAEAWSEGVHSAPSVRAPRERSRSVPDPRSGRG